MERTRFNVGDRVRVTADFNWALGAGATVANYPDFLTAEDSQLDASVKGHFRDVQGVNGIVRYYYWLKFDEPQMDAEGDGPYAAAEIAEDYLKQGT